MPKLNKNNIKIIIAILIALVCGIGIGNYYTLRKDLSVLAQAKLLREKDPNYKFISPLLGSDFAEKQQYEELYPFENKIQKAVQTLSQNDPNEHIGVYFRDLNNGSWVGVNENDNFSPGSLTKVPLMMAYLKLAETNPSLLDQLVVYNGPDVTKFQDLKPSQSITIGKPYTVNDMIDYMIKYSDNNAFNALLDYININTLKDLFTDFGLQLPTSNNDSDTDFISVKGYSLFFRSLYNSSYLDHNFSNKALELLSQTDYNSGIVAGIPTNLVISHKFGEKMLAGSQPGSASIYQLHDCGIIYYPNNPYELCVMTKGSSMADLQTDIKNISQLVYDQVDNANKK